MYESLQQADADAAKHHADLPYWPLVVYGAVEDVRHSNVVGYSDNPARVQNGALEQFDFGGKGSSQAVPSMVTARWPVLRLP